nr:AAA family ATPase [Ardenticatena sp.]
MDVFEHARREQNETEAPLAARMRPRTLDEFVGQAHIIGPGRLLRRAIQADQLSSLIFYGPPGTGKTTLARIIANTTKAHFIAINAVLAGVKDIRQAIERAQEQRNLYGRRTILFVDEVHRFNKAQQDALLPWVENGTVILIGATTENPYFEVNKALVSRSRIFQLKPLREDDLRRIAENALRDPERGYGRLNVQIEEDALAHLVNVANGDARALLNALELAVETTPPNEQGVIHITLDVAEESIQRRAVLYDKEGDAHFDTISAFIKSVRGSDPDAALYWLARMVYAGEDPRFIFRRLLILASEDVGLADPHAIVVVNACAAAFDRVGMPEGQFHLAHATLYLATAPKSNSTMGFFDALRLVEETREGEVPTHLRDSNRDKQGFGHGEGYRYPHAYRDHWVAQQYLPETLQGHVFYTPSTQGYEATIAEQVARRREAQIAALSDGVGLAPPEVLTFSPADTQTERWLQRTLGQQGERLAFIRDRVFEYAAIQRHHVVLDLHAARGLLTWEAVRRTPEGGVFALVRTTEEEEHLRREAEALPHLRRPHILRASPETLAVVLGQIAPDVRFDRMIGYALLAGVERWDDWLRHLRSFLAAKGWLVLAEPIPRETQRLSALVPAGALSDALLIRWQRAEEKLYAHHPRLNRDETTLVDALQQAGWHVNIETQTFTSEIRLSPATITRWLRHNATPPSYVDLLRETVGAEEIEAIASALRALAGQTVRWHSRVAFIRATSSR